MMKFTAAGILHHLEVIANKNLIVNVWIHMFTLVSTVSIYFSNQSPEDRIKRTSVLTWTTLGMFISVAVHAFLYFNPFNLVNFSILAIFAFLAMITQRHIKLKFVAEKLQKPRNPLIEKYHPLVCIFLIFMGMWYPEFVKNTQQYSAFQMFFMAPLGVVPCPTLITILGLCNYCYQDVHKKLFGMIIFYGFLYSIIGILYLGISLDIILLGASFYSLFNL